MKNFKRPLALSILAMTVLVTSFNNCTKVSFQKVGPDGQMGVTGQSSIDQGAPTDTTTPGAPTPLMYQKTVAAIQTVAPLDIVWVIDNSGSMNAEAGYVRDNFSDFISFIQGQADLRLALISQIVKTDSAGQIKNNGVTLPVADNLKQIKIDVGSHDGLGLLASALCPASGAPDSCNATGITTNSLVRGQLTSFLRANSKKVFIIVTDDDSTLSAASFSQVLNDVLPGQKVVISAFRGMGPVLSTCEAAEGTVYNDLVQSSGGSEFNVCSQNWSDHFAVLADKAVLLAYPTIDVPSDLTIDKIISVELNGVLLTAADFQLNGTALTLQPAVTAGVAELSIKILYNP